MDISFDIAHEEFSPAETGLENHASLHFRLKASCFLEGLDDDTLTLPPCSRGSLQLLHILIAQVQRREVARLASFRLDENPVIFAALEVLLPFDRAVILPSRLVESNADPGA